MHCSRCNKEKDRELFPPKKHGWCNECLNKSALRYHRKMYDENPEYRIKMQKKAREWRIKNPEILRKQRDRAIIERNERKQRLLRKYSNGEPKCACCGEKETKFLSLDHIDGNGKNDRKKNGFGTTFYRYLEKENYPSGFQVLCFNCNLAKGMFGKCPHEK